MRKSEKEIKNRAELEEVIQKAEVCRLGFVDGDEPYIVPMNFGYRDNALYFHCAPEGRKLDLIRKNNKVCFELEADVELISGTPACRWSTLFRSVIGTGRAFIVEENDAKLRGMAILMAHYTKSPPLFEPENLAKAVVIRVDIIQMTGKKSRI